MNVLLFGIAKDIVGTQELRLEKALNIKTVKELTDFLKNKYPEFQKLRSIAIAVNSNYAEMETALTESDEIAIIPPVSGG
ncbi:molybdopterin converting factor subunit 1 [Ascidiimonas sp. W6]|uniref:molybdopterin converting factor subunit 1 n=1 Tax=Ascidiimonas meishanensis TaxID=3128903 RepID=UPI0030EE5119